MIALVALFAFALLAFGVWIGINARTGPQFTLGTALAFVGALALIVMFMLALPVHAHDHARPELNAWLKTLRNKNNVPCCDGSDATRLSDVDWDAKDGHYRVRLEGEWVDVPDAAVVESPNHAGQTLVWPYYKDGKMVPRCFLPGSMT